MGRGWLHGVVWLRGGGTTTPFWRHRSAPSVTRDSARRRQRTDVSRSEPGGRCTLSQVRRRNIMARMPRRPNQWAPVYSGLTSTASDEQRRQRCTVRTSLSFRRRQRHRPHIPSPRAPRTSNRTSAASSSPFTAPETAAPRKGVATHADYCAGRKATTPVDQNQGSGMIGRELA